MKIAIYTPYLDNYGGGERYMLTIAECLSMANQVDILLDSHLQQLGYQSFKKNASSKLSLDLSKVNLVKAPLGVGSSLWQRLAFLKKYDYLFYLTDGSIFFSTAKKNIIHFQAPLVNQNRGMWGNKKISSWDLGICNSKFTEEVIKKSWPIKLKVVYPPVDVSKIKPWSKKKYILSVGRLLGYKRPKKHQVLIETFKKMFDQKLIPGWSLHIAGYITKDELGELADIKEDLKKYPIIFYPNYPFENLVKLYGESSIYWHATGYGEDDPVDMEHFGITTVEAMAAEAVPVVINKGGQPEIVEKKKSGFLWDSVEELTECTLKVINNSKLRDKLGKNARQRSKMFSKEHFMAIIEDLINNAAA